MASAYIRSKGDGFKDVFQLSGGIQRYLEAFPGGGYFQGKNFVFDHRISVPSTRDETVGCCLTCGIPYDDYSLRSRCSLCRMLVLVCDNCKASTPYICELCRSSHIEAPRNHEQSKDTGSKLRILCLHGFRQNASNLKGRLASLSKKLRRTADFVFVNAPHELPFVYQPQRETDGAEEKILPQTQNKKFAWLIDPTSPTVNAEASEGSQEWTRAEVPFDAMQYKSQSSGWSQSWSYIEKVFSELGPFDGVLGFSQGAAVAAVLASLRDAGKIDFKFVILCSGFLSPALEHEQLWKSDVAIQCPSLHVFSGSAGIDRQIGRVESEKLAAKFDPSSRKIVCHSSGHIIPTRPEYVEQYLEFLNQYVA